MKDSNDILNQNKAIKLFNLGISLIANNKRILSLILTLLFISFLFNSLNNVFLSPSQVERGIRTDLIVCLAGGKGRIEKCVELLQDGVAEHLFISGTGPKFNKENYLNESNQELKDKITADNLSKSTFENAYNSLSFVRARDIRSFVLVTSDYHLKRSFLIFHRIFPNDVTIKTFPIRGNKVNRSNWWKSHVGFKIVSREWLKWIRTRWFFYPWNMDEEEEPSED